MNRSFLRALFVVPLVAAAAAVSAGPVDINSADAPTLAAELNGVGPALAEAIVRDRMEHGRYASADDLIRVKGIGEHVVELNRSNILVESPAAP